jgi:hypothetical protein
MNGSDADPKIRINAPAALALVITRICHPRYCGVEALLHPRGSVADEYLGGGWSQSASGGHPGCRSPSATCPPSVPLTSWQENKMNVWLSSQAVARIAELLAVVAAASDTSDQYRDELSYCRRQIGELMPTHEVLVLAGVLREATDRPGLSAAVRTDCWSWSSYLARLLVASPTATATIDQPVARTRPARNAVLVPSVDRGPVEVASRRPRGSAVVMW